MKRLFSTLMAALMVAASALAVNAGTFVYDESDGEYWDANYNQLDRSANYIWYEGAASNHGIPKLNDEIAPNCDLNQTIEHGWYEAVLCNLGSTPEMFPDDVVGKAAFIIRGTSTFTVKTENALNAGAEVVFIGNNAVTGENIDETGAMNGTYANVDSPSIEYETMPMGLFNTDMCVQMVADAAGVSIAEAVAAVKAVGDGAADLGLTHKNTIWVFYGTAAEFEAAGDPPVAEEEIPAAEVIEEVEVAETVVEAAPQTFDLGVIAAFAAVVSAAGYTLSKKR